MKILLVTEFFPCNELKFTGGVETRTYYLAKYLARTNEVLIICRKYNHLYKFKQIGKIKIYPCGLKTSLIPVSLLSVIDRIIYIVAATLKGLSLNFDIVEGSNFISFLPAFVIGKLKGKPIVVWIADMLGRDWWRYYKFPGLFGFVLEKICLTLPWTKIIALSNNTKEKLIKLGINKGKISVIYGGVEKIISKIKYQKSKMRNIICISRLVKYKRVDDIINAFSQLNKKYNNLTLTIIGLGPEEQKLKQLVRSLGLSTWVKFYQNLTRNELIEKLKKSYLFCSASLLEGFDLAVIEAASFGIPYVISDIPTHREISRDSLGGLLFQQSNSKDLQIKLELLLADKSLYWNKQLECKKLVLNYQWQEIARQTEKVYLKALNV